MERLTKNFTVDEMRCKCGRCGLADMDSEFMKKLQQARDLWGKEMVILSPFRCAEWNKKVGGAPHSMHLKGRAVDIAYHDSESLYRLIRIFMGLGFNGIGVSRSFLHVDDRDKKTFWTYN